MAGQFEKGNQEDSQLLDQVSLERAKQRLNYKVRLGHEALWLSSHSCLKDKVDRDRRRSLDRNRRRHDCNQ
jgi:hypothetical protein